MDANSQGAAELVTALMRTAARFSEMGRSLSRDFFPHVRPEPVSDLAGPAVRLGAVLALPGHDLVFEVALAVGDKPFTIRGELVLDGEEEILVLPPAEVADPIACAALLERYVDELTTPARWQVQRLLESCEAESREAEPHEPFEPEPFEPEPFEPESFEPGTYEPGSFRADS